MQINRNESREKLLSFFVFAIRWLLILAVGYIILYPLLQMLSQSLMTQEQYTDTSVVWVPKEISFVNFKVALQALDYYKTLLWTIVVNVLSALIQVLTCAFTAYGFSRFNFRGKSFFMALLIFSIIVPAQMTVIPSLINYRQFDVLGILKVIGALIGTDIRPNLVDTPFTFYLPSLFSVGLRSGIIIFIYMQFFKGLPKELEEAAAIDGASSLKTFLRIVLPSSGVAIVSVLILSVIWHWNEYFLSVMYFSANNTLSVRLANVRMYLENIGVAAQMAVTTGVVKAACLLFILPMLIMYLIMQRKFIQSIDSVGIVG
jgi:multiple sugar transport system permease protein